MTAPGWGAGSADELNALLTTLTQWAQRAMPAPPSGHAGPECQWCPLCQLASALRGEHPEFTDSLAEAGAAIAVAARALLESASRGASKPDAGTVAASGPAATAPTAARSRPRPRIERIDLDDAAGPG